MTAKFEFNGGLLKPGPEREVKFLCFLLCGQEEVPLFQMKRNGLIDVVVEPVQENGPVATLYTTRVTNVVKVFVQDRFQEHRRWYSFWFEVKDKRSPLVTIRPFPPIGGDADMSGYFFRARGHFLTKNEALALLPPESTSAGYLKTQRILPVETLKKMVSIDRTILREGVRFIRIGNKTGA